MSLRVVNIGGTTFQTNETTLKKINYFKYLFEDTNITDNDIPFVNRPAHIFKHVLVLVIDDTYKYPAKYKNELDFYDVEYNIDKLYDPSLLIMKRIDELKDNIEAINNNTEEYCIRRDCDNLSLHHNYCKEHVYICDYLVPSYYDASYYCCEKEGLHLNEGHYRCDEHTK